MKKVILGSLYFVPLLASAQLASIRTLVERIGDIIGLLGPIIFGLAIVYFFWGIAKYVLAAGDPKAAAEGRSIMIWGVIAIAVMASLYGLVGWLQGTLDIDKTTNAPVVEIPIP